MNEIDLDELEAKANAATTGPWHWAGNTDTGEPYLATWISGAGRCQVLSIGSEDRSTTGREADSVRSSAEEYGLGNPEDAIDDWAFDRDGQPMRDPRLQFMTDLMCVNAREHAIYEVAPSATSREDPEVYRADVVGIRHPDAEFMAAAHPAVVLALVAELRAARASLRAAGVTEQGEPSDAELAARRVERAMGAGEEFDYAQLRALIDHVRSMDAALRAVGVTEQGESR